jgi:hypothetical protein
MIAGIRKYAAGTSAWRFRLPTDFLADETAFLTPVTWHGTCSSIATGDSEVLFSDRGARDWCRCTSLAVALWTVAAASADGPGFSAGFSAILGGIGQDYAAAVATDPQGNVYVAGLTYSPDFPVTPGALQTKIGTAGTSDAFVAKFAPDGALLWSTFLGGAGDDWATGVAVDAAGNVLVTGWTRSANFPVFHAFQGTLNNGASPARYDAFVAKLDPTGTRAPLFDVPRWRWRRRGLRRGAGRRRQRLRHRSCPIFGKFPRHEEPAQCDRDLRLQTGSPGCAGLLVPPSLRHCRRHRRGR